MVVSVGGGFAARRRRRAARPLPPGSGDVVWREAHLELSSPAPSPGSRFDVTVFASAAPPWGSEPPGASDQPGHENTRGALAVEVRLLCSDELEAPDGPAIQTISIRRHLERSTDASFSVRVRPDSADGAIGHLTALFTHNNRPCGYLHTAVPITSPRSQPLTPATSLISSRGPGVPDSGICARPSILRIEPRATPPDLLVRVTATAANDGRSFVCEVIPRFGTQPHEPEPWNLPDSAPRLVEALMEEFTGGEMSPRHRRDTLIGAGTELFDVAPANFRKTFWNLIDEGHPPRSIFICTEEPAIPWELMVPYRDLPDGTAYRQPLGVEFAIGRWVGDPAGDPRLGNPHKAPLQIRPLTTSVVIAPEYQGDLALTWAAAEVDLVIGQFPGVSLKPAIYDEIDGVLQGVDAGLLHFVGHGRAEARGAHVLVLENDETLSSTALRGMAGARSFGGRCHPVVFLNGCEMGRLKPALAGVEGFATALIRQGARCVIAPLWSVKDAIAHEVATEFYRQHALHPDLPLGQVFQGIRSRAYDPASGEDSYAAYAFFGDPLSRARE